MLGFDSLMDLAYGMPVEFVVGLAIAYCLDPDAETLDGCGVGIHTEQVGPLKRARGTFKVSAA